MKIVKALKAVFLLSMMFGLWNNLQAQKTTIGNAPPEGAIVLFDGTRESLDSNWMYWEGPRLSAEPPIKWKIVQNPSGIGTAVSSNDPAAANGKYGAADIRSEERRVGKEGRHGGWT